MPPVRENSFHRVGAFRQESERSIGSAVTGTGVSRNQSLMAGDTVNLTGTLPAAGMYGLTRVAHRWTAAGYQNEFVCTPWKQFWNAEEPTLRSWNGIVPARVVDHNDWVAPPAPRRCET